jgi:hypothetical protein
MDEFCGYQKTFEKRTLIKKLSLFFKANKNAYQIQ